MYQTSLYQYLFDRPSPDEFESWDIHLPTDHPAIKALLNKEFPGCLNTDPVLILEFDKGDGNPRWSRIELDEGSGITIHPQPYKGKWYITIEPYISANTLKQWVQDNEQKEHSMLYCI